MRFFAWAVGLTLILGVTASAQTKRPQRGIVLEGEQKLRYICKQLDLTADQQQDMESHILVYNEMSAAERDPTFLLKSLTEIQALTIELNQAREAGEKAKEAELRARINEMVPGYVPEKQFFESVESMLTDAQKKSLAETRARLAEDSDVSLKHSDVLRIAKAQNLSADQFEKLDKVLVEFRSSSARIPDADLHARVADVDRLIKAVREILTAEQAANFDRQIERLRPPMPAAASQPVKKAPEGDPRTRP